MDGVRRAARPGDQGSALPALSPLTEKSDHQCGKSLKDEQYSTENVVNNIVITYGDRWGHLLP